MFLEEVTKKKNEEKKMKPMPASGMQTQYPMMNGVRNDNNIARRMEFLLKVVTNPFN